jgi:LuxR family maltose regulon positive regulatory protein
MPGSPREHDLERESVRYFQSQLPSGWPCQPVQADYGKDLLVEIHEGGFATGLEFRVQVKGHERPNIVYGDRIAELLKVSTLNYFDRLLVPVLLVVYAAEERRAHYLWVKPYIREVLDGQEPDWRAKKGGSEITLHVPLASNFDETASDDILSHVEAEHARLELRRGPLARSSSRRSTAWSTSASSRLIRPRVTEYLHRPRLTKRLSDILPGKAVFLHADAGYGKTWLIHDFVDVTEYPLIWYTFVGDGVDGIQFIEELASEASRHATSCGKSTLAYRRARGEDARVEEAVAILIDELESSGAELLLAIEDVHNVSNKAVLSVVESLVSSRPPNLRLILTSRLPLPFGQARFVAQGLLAVIERPQIAFGLDETQQYLERTLELDLEPKQIEHLHDRTGGWIAAIGLAASALQNTSSHKVQRLFERLQGFDGHIYDFFAEEVYTRLEAETKWILKRLGLVQTIEPAIVNLFTERTDGGQVLKDLIQRNAFLIEDDARAGSYRLHALFAEFLRTRFRDEEGEVAVRSAHNVVARHYAREHDWYPATQQALDAREYKLAARGLETIVPVAVNSGYSHAALEMIDRIPAELLEQSARLQELLGQAALHIGDPRRAREAFEKAEELYKQEDNPRAENRLRYLVAEAELITGDIAPESFVRIVDQVASESYRRNDVLFGVQAELRLLEIGQTLTMQVDGLFHALVDRSDSLVVRIEDLGDQYPLIKARALSDQARLLAQAVSTGFQQGLFRLNVRVETGHPVPLEERVEMARALLAGLQRVSELYVEAERTAKEESEIEWARIRLNRISYRAHQMSLLHVMNASLGMTQEAPLLESIGIQLQEEIGTFLPAAQQCALVFAKYHMSHDLAIAYCDMADLCDMLGDSERRDKLAREALALAEEKELESVVQRAQRILEDEFTFSSLKSRLERRPTEGDLASSSEEDKARFTEFCLRAYARDADIDEMREAVRSDVEDMVLVAQQKAEWCRHVEIIQDLRHTRSLDTIYRTIPKKWIVCAELGYRSPHPGRSFEELWPLFKGVYCLGCSNRSLDK